MKKLPLAKLAAHSECQTWEQGEIIARIWFNLTIALIFAMYVCMYVNKVHTSHQWIGTREGGWGKQEESKIA